MAYDVTEAFEDMEMALIESMRNNMKRHIKDEYEEGMNWTQWQAEMLAGMSKYRAENKDVLKGYMGKMNDRLDAVIREAYTTGESEQEIALLKAIKRGYKPPKDGSKANMSGAFFKTNQRKLNALVKATTNDMKKAETAMLRMSDDVYRKTLFKAQMHYNAGAGGMWKCVDMATKDFLKAGYNCVEYKNGARVNIASYSEMALRTANKRANIMGAAEFRESRGMHLVKVNARGTACPKCLPYLGKVFVDDVYGKGTKQESKETGYPLLSAAVKGGLFHPNCKDACSTYYEGINRPPKEVSEKTKKETMRRYDLEQQQRYFEREYRKNLRLANGSLTEEDVKLYTGKARDFKDKLVNLCDENSDVLRLDKQRLNLRGVLTVDSKGRISAEGLKLEPEKKPKIPTIPSSGKDHTEAYNKLADNLDYVRERKKLEYRPVEKLKKTLTTAAIIERVAGGDLTSGSCASLGFAYVGNRAGLDVLDYRGGASMDFFSTTSNLVDVSKLSGVKSTMVEDYNAFKAANAVLRDVEEGKEYYFVAGQHAAIVRKIDGKYQYLELQSATNSGWHQLTTDELRYRFGCKKSRTVYGNKLKQKVFSIDVDTLKDSDEFKDLLGYINTAGDKQKKGAAGHER